MSRDRLFNPRQRTLLRPSIPTSEKWVSLTILLLLAAIAIWVMAQKNNFDPSTRSLSPEVLLEGSDRDALYTPPLKPWTQNPFAATTAPDVGVIPAQVMDAEWQAKNPVKIFNAANLFEKINGEAPRFFRQGFESMHYLVLQSKNTQQEIAIELYQVKDAGGSMGLFAEHQRPGAAIEQQGKVFYFRTSIGLIGRKGRFFFRVSGDSASEDIQQKAERLAVVFQALPEEEQTDDSLALEMRILTEGIGIAPEQVYLQRENVFQFDFVQDVWFGKLAQDSQEQLFIHQADSAEQAQLLFEEILAEQSYDYETRYQNATVAILRHEYLNNYFIIGLQGTFIFGVENGADAERSETLLRQLKEAITNGK